MRKRIAATAVLALLIAIATIVTPTLPANAAAAQQPGPQPGPGPKTGTIKIPIKTADGASTNVIVCIDYTAPEPQYSGSNKNIHWGVGASCTEDGPWAMTFEAWLYTVTGSGDNTRRWQEDHFGPRAGLYLRTHTEGKFTACLSSTSTRWVTKIKATIDGSNMVPEYGWSDVWTFPCA